MVDKTTTQGDDEHSEPLDSGRREFLKKSVLVAGAAGVGGWSMSAATAWAAGSDKPEKPEINVGFIPLTDCAPIVVASVMGFDKKYGIKINVSAHPQSARSVSLIRGRIWVSLEGGRGEGGGWAAKRRRSIIATRRCFL